MMDCRTPKGYLLERKRMCESFSTCLDCPLCKEFTYEAERKQMEMVGSCYDCENLIIYHEEKVLDVIQKWADENPRFKVELCPICDTPNWPKTFKHESNVVTFYKWTHYCNNSVKIDSGEYFLSEQEAYDNWNEYCGLMKDKILDAYDKGQTEGFKRGQEAESEELEIKKCSICGGKPGFGSNKSGHYFHHTCKGVHRKIEGINGSFYKTHLDAIKSNEKYIYKESAIISWNTYCDLLDTYVEAMENG